MVTILTDEDKKTALNPSKLPTKVGDFKLTKLTLSSTNIKIASGELPSVDLTTSAWHELNFYEDINSPIVSGDIKLTDAVGLIETFPIIGEEILEVSFSTAGAATPPIPFSGGPPNLNLAPTAAEAPKLIINRFRIYKADPPVQVTDNSRTIKLYFTTDNQFTNLLTKVRKIYPTIQNDPIPAAPPAAAIPDPTFTSDPKTYTLADMARDIFYDFFIGTKKPPRQPKTRKSFLVEPTRYKSEIIIPNWSPFKALSFLASKAVSASPDTKGANFVFYQTLQGFRFVSIETLMLGGFRNFEEMDEEEVASKYPHLVSNAISGNAINNKSSHIPIFRDTPTIDETRNPIVASYKYAPANMGETKESSYESVTSFKLIDSFDTMKNVALGMYANRVITHDLIRMKVDRKNFHYITPASSITVTEPTGGNTTAKVAQDDLATIQIDESVSTEIGKLCSDNADFLGRPEAHISLVPTNFGQAARYQDGPVKANGGTTKNENGDPIKLDIKENHVEDVIARRISQRLQLDSVKIHFSAPGDSAREVGDLIAFDYPTENPKVPDASGLGSGHKYYSGKFLITKLRHKITQDEYTIHAEAIKDGYRSAISSTFEVTDPVVQEVNPLTGLTEAKATETVESLGIATT
jgi:hypothetical protein